MRIIFDGDLNATRPRRKTFKMYEQNAHKYVYTVSSQGGQPLLTCRQSASFLCGELMLRSLAHYCHQLAGGRHGGSCCTYAKKNPYVINFRRERQ